MARKHRNTITLTREITIEAEIEVEIDGRYMPAKTQGDPDSCHPAEYPEASIAEVRICGVAVDIDSALTKADMSGIEEEALAQVQEAEADDYYDAAEAREDARRDARYED